MLQVEGVGSLDRHTEGAGPHLGWHNTESAGDAEEDCVVVVLGETVVHQQGSGAAVNIWPWVLDLASGCEKARNGLKVGSDQVNQVVILDMLLSELHLK